MKRLIIISILTILFSCQSKKENKELHTPPSIVKYDSHVHLMSPELIKYWKELGIPFSKSESNYSDIDTILANNKATYINLIGMGYVYGNPEYYEGDDAYQQMMNENNYLLKVAEKYEDKMVFAVASVRDLSERWITDFELLEEIERKDGCSLSYNL